MGLLFFEVLLDDGRKVPVSPYSLVDIMINHGNQRTRRRRGTQGKGGKSEVQRDQKRRRKREKKPGLLRVDRGLLSVGGRVGIARGGDVRRRSKGKFVKGNDGLGKTFDHEASFSGKSGKRGKLISWKVLL